MQNFLKGMVHFSLLSFGPTIACLATSSRIDAQSKKVKRKHMLTAYFDRSG
jgi:hypothetical protein